MAAIGDDVLLGTQIGAYKVARLLGVGGMGRVYKGVHPQIGSRVAIKVLSRECSDRRDLVERFFSEARAVNLIRHESIVNVLDLATLPDGRPYIIMEYLDGAPRAALAGDARGAAPIGSVARIAVEVLDALGAAHAKGIIHRDLKPDNIYVSPAGRAKVLDFGIAKLLPELGGQYTQTGSLLGTPHYMSPEQATGRPVDARTDLYAMGVILFECLIGQKPFQGDSLFDLLRKHVDAAPPPPRALRPDLSPELEQVILIALAKAPEQRFQTAQAMSMALQAATAQLAPEQWAPLTTSSGSPVRSASGAGWGSQPSWGNGTPPPGNPSTVSAGQVTSPRGGGSRLGLWVGLGALVLVGGGVAAAVVIGGGAGGSGTAAVAGAGSAVAAPVGAPAPAAAASGSAVVAAGSAVGSGAGSAVVASGSAGSAGSAAGSAAPTLIAAGSAVEKDDDTDDTKDDADDGKDDPDDPTATKPKPVKPGKDPKAPQLATDTPAAGKPLLKPADIAQMRQAIAALKQAGAKPAMLAKVDAALDRLAKASTPEELKASADQLQQTMMAAANSMSGAAPPSDPIDKPDPGKGNGWFKYTQLDRPAGFTPARFDAQGYLKTALAEARRLVPDAVLFRIDADGLFSDGHADLTLEGKPSVGFRFQSPSRSKRDPSLPLGVEPKWQCAFQIIVSVDGVAAIPMDGWACKESNIGPPRCSFAAVWKRAIAKGAPSQPAVGSLGYRPVDGKGRWYFDVKGTFSTMFDDGC
jgi:serine/threonine-protein kinase